MKKKIALFLALFLMLASPVFAHEAITLLYQDTITGAGYTTRLPGLSSQFTCHVTWGGTTPTNTVVALEGSLDNTTFAALATETITASGQMWHVVYKPVKYIRGNYVSKTDGDATTSVTLVCGVVE